MIGNQKATDNWLNVLLEIPIDKLMIDRIYVNVTGSFTVERYFNIVFQGTGMLFEVEGKVKSSKFENGGEGDTRLEMFKRD